MKKVAFPIEIGLLNIILGGATILFLFPLIHRIFGYSGYFFAGLASVVCLGIPITICYRETGTFKNRFKNFRTTLIWGLIFSIVAFLACWGRVAIEGKYIPHFSFSYLTSYTFVTFLNILLLPILEEILDSAYILHLLVENLPKITAILVTALLSTAAHIGIYSNIFSLIYILVVSIIFLFAYLKGGLGTSIISHIVFNLLANIWR